MIASIIVCLYIQQFFFLFLVLLESIQIASALGFLYILQIKSGRKILDSIICFCHMAISSNKKKIKFEEIPAINLKHVFARNR